MRQSGDLFVSGIPKAAISNNFFCILISLYLHCNAKRIWLFCNIQLNFSLVITVKQTNNFRAQWQIRTKNFTRVQLIVSVQQKVSFLGFSIIPWYVPNYLRGRDPSILQSLMKVTEKAMFYLKIACSVRGAYLKE